MRLSTKIAIGAILGLLNAAVANVYLAGRPIGASTSYPYLADQVFRLGSSAYFGVIKAAGSWELVFLAGTFAGALTGAMAFGRFRVETVPPLWNALKGASRVKRIAWAFIGGFLLILGARLADGCTSGHILSGGMELALSSLVFTAFVLISAVVTARCFYGNVR